ncbi:MAG TPA: CxxC-x17-CxxC domain-containing protein [Candidatus Nanoarchaeia archaeon]|nr:CxxC-x17-CxxC domain-containing protein [Candidatus Nanoarchaeia archaeon]
MHQAVCNRCKSECEVPFRPTGDKPIFCSNCFRKKNSSERNESSGPSEPSISQEALDQINRKLDQIIKSLDIK